MIPNDVPAVFGAVDDSEQFRIIRTNGSSFGQRLEVDHLVPELLAEQQQRDALHAARLDQRQRFEELIERAEAAGEDGDGLGAQQEVDLAGSQSSES